MALSLTREQRETLKAGLDLFVFGKHAMPPAPADYAVFAAAVRTRVRSAVGILEVPSDATWMLVRYAYDQAMKRVDEGEARKARLVALTHLLALGDYSEQAVSDSLSEAQIAHMRRSAAWLPQDLAEFGARMAESAGIRKHYAAVVSNLGTSRNTFQSGRKNQRAVLDELWVEFDAVISSPQKLSERDCCTDR